MNEPETTTPSPDSTPDQQASLVASLQRQITILLLALIVVSGTLTAYLFYQSRILGQQLRIAEPQARVALENYNKNWLPQAQKLVNDLVAYGEKHRDFQPILKKYGIPLTPQGTTNATAKPKP